MKSKPPGTFIVRDSNSFPGAFGLAVKVATPPPNVKASSSGGDPANELVRHFLIEPTARGVRLKGCTNEPVFGEPRRGSTDLDDLNNRIFELTYVRIFGRMFWTIISKPFACTVSLQWTQQYYYLR